MADHDLAGAKPVSLLTGFLGSGKTTVLNHLLRHPDLARTVVVINEFGEIGLDHELVEAATENLVLLQSGCLCCTIRGDFVETLHNLVDRVERGEIDGFDRVVIETTGLADPAPILHTLMTDSFIAHTFRLDGVIVTVDAAAGAATLDAQDEAVKQAAMADRILLTKTDLVEPDAVEALQARLRVLNPGAPIIRAHNGAVEPSRLLNAGLYNPKSKSLDVQTWLNAEAYGGPDQHHAHGHHHGHDHSHHHGHQHHEGDVHDHHHHHDHEHDVNRHDDRISAVTYTVDEPIGADVFDKWLETLMLLRGPNILRMKGIVNVEGAPAPFVLHGVQHIFHPPVVLRNWPSHDRRSRIVLIGRDLTDDFLKQSFSFLGSGHQRQHDHHASTEHAA
ncbi:MAG: GTP-binding protein [Pseudomonadota bacterium]